MKWITASNLEAWSQTNEARAIFPELIGDLIRASASQISSFRFPSGDKGQVRGFDGWLEATGCPPFVPDGPSIWEFGVTSDAGKKFKNDLEKRTKESDKKKQDRSSLTFVFVSLQTADNPKENFQKFVQSAAEGKGWKGVVYLDGMQLEHWLSACPAVASRYAKNHLNLIPRYGARSTDEFWEEYSNRFKPQLNEEVLLCGRHANAEELIKNLIAVTGAVRLAADSPDEVVAFAIAAIRKADVEIRVFLESRILIVESHEASLFVASLKNLIFFPRGQASAQSGLLASKGPTLIAIGRDQSNSDHKYLFRPSYSEFGKALQTMGFEEAKASELSRSCGRIITVLARQIPGGNVAQPEWMPEAQKLIPAIFAGGWDCNLEPDRLTVAALAEGVKYNPIEAHLRKISKMQDPLIDQEGTIWKIRAPIDAFIHVGHLLGSDELERLEKVVLDVFSQLMDPPKDDEEFSIKPKNNSAYSSWVRDGLATTLLQMAVLHKQAGVNIAGVDPQHWVNSLIEQLPGLRDDPRLISSLRAELPILMEAAPDPLLSALEHHLEGKSEIGRAFFWDRDAMFGPTSPHVYLLWALEILAWDPKMLERITLILGKFCEFSTKPNSGNKPIASLRSIFLPWNPNTFATLEQRMVSLDCLIRSNPNVGWLLAVELLPKSHDSNVPTSKPRFRESNASDAELLTYGLVRKGREGVIDRVLKMAEGSSTRLLVVIESLYQWDTERRGRALQVVDQFLSSSKGDELNRVWSSLNDLSNRHHTFIDTDWALSEASLVEIDQLIKKYEPEEPLTKFMWLFDDWVPAIPVPYKDREKSASIERGKAIREIHSYYGDHGIFQLAEAAKHTHIVTEVFANELLESPEDFTNCILLALDRGTANSEHFALVLSALADQKFPNEWKKLFRDTANSQIWTTKIITKLMFAWVDELSTWQFVDSFGGEVTKEYWTEKRAIAFRCSVEEALKGADYYLRFGRPGAALVSLQQFLTEVPTKKLFEILDALVSELNSSNTPVNTMMSYYIEQAFEELDKRTDVQSADIAHREYAYLPIMDDRKRPLAIHTIMASDPVFYMSLISSVFRSDDDTSQKGEGDDDSSELKRAKWRTDYKLLSDFHVIPGLIGSAIDYDILYAWVSRIRELAAQEKRSAIADQYIGHILAHSPNVEDGLWPHENICRLIEDISSDQIERGFRNECFNKRGVFGREMFEGGTQERELAIRYRNWSKEALRFPRTSAVLKNIAKNWDEDAEREDVRAKQDKLKY
jgi:hypothetical protein